MTAHFSLKLHRAQKIVHSSRSRFRVIVAGRRWGKCLAPGSRITMMDGSVKAVEDVRPGDFVLTLDQDTYELIPQPVKAVLVNGVRETMVLRTAGRSIRCTPNHPFLVNNTWVEAKDIRPGDLVAVARQTPFGDERMKSHELDYLAIWLAEGARHIVSNTTPEILDVLRAAVGEMPGTSLKQMSETDWYVTTGRGSGKWTEVAPATELLKRHGLWGLNSKTKTIPDAVYRLPADQLARFLNLFVACDGCITRRSKKTWSLEIDLANEKMVRQIAELLLKFGIRGAIRHKLHRKLDRNGQPYESWGLVVSDPQSLIVFADEIGALSKETQVAQARADAWASRGNSNAYLPISHDDLVEHLAYEPVEKGKYGGYNCRVARDLPEGLRQQLTSWRKQSAHRISRRRYEALRESTDGYFDPLADGGVMWEEIRAVETSGPCQTYDLTVEGNHNFFAEGICTHNTNFSKTTAIRTAADKPRQLVWYVAPTYQQARDIMWEDLCDSIPPAWLAGEPNQTRMIIRLVNGSRIQLKGADKPNSLRGVGLNFVIIDEAQDMKEEVWEKVIQPTLATTNGRALIIGTPKAYNWLYQKYMLGQRGPTYIDAKGLTKRNDWMSWQFPTISSPFIPRAEIEARRADMDPKSFRQEFEASFEVMAGRVYYPFNRDIHVGEYPFNPTLPIHIGMDFNIDPMSAIIIQEQPDGQVWVVDECVLYGSNVQEVADELSRRYWRYMKQIHIFPDPAGNNRNHDRGETSLEILRDAGFKNILFKRKHPLVMDRINSVNRLIMDAAGVPRLRVNHICRNFIDSAEQTIFKEGSSEVDKRLSKEHAMDAFGYYADYRHPIRKPLLLGVSV